METLITVTSTGKEEIYREILPQIEHLVKDEPDTIANLANTSAVLKMTFNSISWVGFYLLHSDELVLGPFQGKPACVRIQIGKGVSGTAAQRRATIIVPNVLEFPGHIFCDPDSKSEIVVPLLKGDQFLGVLDLDSASFGTFDHIDQKYLEMIARLLAEKF